MIETNIYIYNRQDCVSVAEMCDGEALQMAAE